jgi:serine/threonine protein kinase
MNGGKVLGVGGQGCIYSPAFSSRNPDKFVTKVASKDNSIDELTVAEYLKEKDPNEKYGVYPFGAQKVNTSKVRKELKSAARTNISKGDLKLCLRSVEDPSQFLQYLVPRYTHDLYRFYPNIAKKDVMDSLLFLLHCIYFLHTNYVVHLDVKLGNVAYSNDKPNNMSFRLADFGWSEIIETEEEVDEVFEFIQKNYSSDTDVWSPLLNPKSRTNQRLIVDTHSKKIALVLCDYYAFCTLLQKYMYTLRSHKWNATLLKSFAQISKQFTEQQTEILKAVRMNTENEISNISRYIGETLRNSLILAWKQSSKN